MNFHSETDPIVYRRCSATKPHYKYFVLTNISGSSSMHFQLTIRVISRASVHEFLNSGEKYLIFGIEICVDSDGISLTLAKWERLFKAKFPLIQLTFPSLEW